MVLNVRKTIRLIRDGERGVVRKRDIINNNNNTYRYTVITRMTRALGWAAMRAILMFVNCEGKSYETLSTTDNLS